MKKVFYVYDTAGKKHRAVVYKNNSGQWVEFFGKDAPPPQAGVPKNSYAYTHGGALYQAAIDKIDRFGN